MLVTDTIPLTKATNSQETDKKTMATPEEIKNEETVNKLIDSEETEREGSSPAESMERETKG